MNSRGFDIAITTIVLIVIGIAVLIGSVFFVKNGFNFLKSGTEPILKAQNLEGVRQACELVCRTENKITYCCEPVSLKDNDVFCYEELLNVECKIDCSAVTCPRS